MLTLVSGEWEDIFKHRGFIEEMALVEPWLTHRVLFPMSSH
jgi:hypothetical protein